MTHHPGSVETMKQTAAEVTLCDDLLRGADEIAKFIFGDAKHRRKVYYLTGEAAKGLPHFKIGVNGRVKVSQRAAQNVTTLGLVRSPRE